MIQKQKKNQPHEMSSDFVCAIFGTACTTLSATNLVINHDLLPGSVCAPSRSVSAPPGYVCDALLAPSTIISHDFTTK